MPRCVVEITVDKAYTVVVFRPLSQMYALVLGLAPVPTKENPEPALPAEFAAFVPEGFLRKPRSMALKLDKDAAGRLDPTPMLVAADWLRDRGWEVIPWGCLVAEFDRAEGKPKAE